MTILHNELQKIFPGLHNVISEANKKLTGTYCFINGKLKKCREFHDKGSVYHYNTTNTKMEETTVTSFKIWLPESGLYQLPNGALFLILKQPKRQWAKSYSDDYYHIIPIDGDYTDNFYEQLSEANKLNIAITRNGFIYWWNQLIGYIKNEDNIVCTNTAFKQELIDWNRRT